MAKTLRDGETLCDCFLRAQDFLSPTKEVKIPRQCGKKLLDGETMKIWLKFCETGFFKDIICQPYYAIIFFVIEFKWLVQELVFRKKWKKQTLN